MKLTKLFLVLASFGALMVASDSMVLAGPPNAGFTVKASVISGCSISAQATMDFGNYNPLSTTDLSSTDHLHQGRQRDYRFDQWCQLCKQYKQYENLW